MKLIFSSEFLSFFWVGEGLGAGQELNGNFDCREEVAKELKSALSSIKLSERGVYVQASTLGSLEALLEFLRTSKIPVSHFYFISLFY